MNTHYADLHPQLNLKEAAERRAPTYARVDGHKGVLGNGFIEIVVESKPEGPSAGFISNKLTGESLRVEFVPFEAHFDQGPASSVDLRLRRMEARQSPHLSALVIDLASDWYDLELSYVLQRGDHYVNKCVVVHNLQKTERLHRLTLFRHIASPDYKVLLHDSGMHFPVVFVRGAKGSAFFSMDSPGTFAVPEDHGFAFTCYPGRDLSPGRGFQSSLMHLGIASLAGRPAVNPYHETAAPLDEGERQWFREFLLRISPVGDLPHVEVKAPALDGTGVSDREAVDQAALLGATHVVLPRMQRDPDAYPMTKTLKTRLRDRGIAPALQLCCNTTDNLRWVALGPNGDATSGPPYNGCLACEEFRNTVVADCEGLMERHGYSYVDVKGAPVVACHATGHAHEPGVESLQRAFQGLAEIAEAIRENGGRVSCSGPYGSYGAGMARLFHGVSVVAPDHPLPLPDIHPARLFADMNRLYFRRSRSFLLPKQKLINTVGMPPESCTKNCYPGASVYPWYLYHDSVGWRYAVISALATGLRHRFEALPPDVKEEDYAFARRWLAWEAEHLDDLREVEEILGTPGIDPVDGYSYTSGKGAVVFLFNTSYDPQEVNLRLRLEHDTDYVVRELWPRELNYLGPNEGLFRRDSEIATTLDPKEARVIEAVRRSPASAKRKRPEVFGAESEVYDGRLMLRGKSGGKAPVAIRTAGGTRSEHVGFPGEPLQTHITDWVCAERSFEEGRASLSKGNFEGEPWTPEIAPERNVWLSSHLYMPESLRSDIDTTAFELRRPVWSYPNRMFFVVRFEIPPFFDPIRTSSDVPGIPESIRTPLPMKYGFDLAPMNIGLHAWVKERECTVYPAVAAWDGYAPNGRPVVAYFFEAGSRLKFDHVNPVVLFARHFVSSAFRGIYIEHPPFQQAETLVEVS